MDVSNLDFRGVHQSYNNFVIPKHDSQYTQSEFGLFCKYCEIAKVSQRVPRPRTKRIVASIHYNLGKVLPIFNENAKNQKIAKNKELKYKTSIN